MRVCVWVFIYFIHVSIFTLTYVLFKLIMVIYLFFFYIAFTHIVENIRIQNTENSEKENSETKQEIRTKREVSKDKRKL